MLALHRRRHLLVIVRWWWWNITKISESREKSELQRELKWMKNGSEEEKMLKRKGSTASITLMIQQRIYVEWAESRWRVFFSVVLEAGGKNLKYDENTTIFIVQKKLLLLHRRLANCDRFPPASQQLYLSAFFNHMNAFNETKLNLNERASNPWTSNFNYFSIPTFFSHQQRDGSSLVVQWMKMGEKWESRKKSERVGELSSWGIRIIFNIEDWRLIIEELCIVIDLSSFWNFRDSGQTNKFWRIQNVIEKSARSCSPHKLTKNIFFSNLRFAVFLTQCVEKKFRILSADWTPQHFISNFFSF